MKSMVRITGIWAAGLVAAVMALALPGSAQATSYDFTGSVADLGSVGNPGVLDFGDSGVTGVNDGTHFDYIFSFTLTDTGKLDANVAADGTDFTELHAVLYTADPSGEALYSNGDPGIIDGASNTNLIDIGSLNNFVAGGSSGGNSAGINLTSLASGSYYLRVFGIPVGSVSHFVGQIGISAVAATPIPAALPLFLSALGALGIAARRKQRATA